MSHLDERDAERSPHDSVDDGIDTRVGESQSLDGIKNQQSVGTVAVRQHNHIQLIRQPGDGECRSNGYAHPGDFTSCLLFGR